jgi:hypothetical protein
MTKDDMIRLIFEAARAHGEQSDPEMEIGDLQNVLIACWDKLREADAADIFHNPMTGGFIDEWLSEEDIKVLLALGPSDVLHMRFGNRYRYKHGVFIDELRSKDTFLINIMGRPSKAVGATCTLGEAKRRAYNWLVGNNVIEEDGDGTSDRS